MRMYWGCPDDELQALINKRERLLNVIRKHIPSAKATYFPMEEKYVVHGGYELKYKDLSGYHYNLEDALEDAVERLKNECL